MRTAWCSPSSDGSPRRTRCRSFAIHPSSPSAPRHCMKSSWRFCNPRRALGRRRRRCWSFPFCARSGRWRRRRDQRKGRLLRHPRAGCPTEKRPRAVASLRRPQRWRQLLPTSLLFSPPLRPRRRPNDQSGSFAFCVAVHQDARSRASSRVATGRSRAYMARARGRALRFVSCSEDWWCGGSWWRERDG